MHTLYKMYSMAAPSTPPSVSCINLSIYLLTCNFVNRRKRRVWHVQYSAWTEQGVPRDVPTYLAALQEMADIRRLSVTR